MTMPRTSTFQQGFVTVTKAAAAAPPSWWKASPRVLTAKTFYGLSMSVTPSSLALFSSMGNRNKDNDMMGETDSPTALYLENLTAFWIGASALCVWFLFFHAPPFILERKVYRDIPLAAHLGSAYTIYLACLVNSLFTPSTLKYGKELHTIIGKIGMVSGFVSFTLGFYCSWLRPVTPPLSFSIGITIGGIAQIVSQIVGWRAIQNFQRISNEEQKLWNDGNAQRDPQKLADLEGKKRASLMTHVYNMVALYTVACGAPALLRATGMVFPGRMGVSGLLVSVVFLNLLVKPFGDTYLHKEKGKIRVAMESDDP
jgi:hypothetical protein